MRCQTRRQTRCQMMNKDVERMRIRAKLSEEDRDFLDAIKRVFPTARLVWLKFKDGEEIGRGQAH